MPSRVPFLNFACAQQNPSALGLKTTRSSSPATRLMVRARPRHTSFAGNANASSRVELEKLPRQESGAEHQDITFLSAFLPHTKKSVGNAVSIKREVVGSGVTCQMIINTSRMDALERTYLEYLLSRNKRDTKSTKKESGGESSACIANAMVTTARLIESTS